MFSYTDSWTNIDSSLVKGVFYDAPKRQMLVRLDGDKQYVYSNVDKSEAEALAVSGSPGGAYNWFRRNRGRGNGGLNVTGETVASRESVVRNNISGGGFAHTGMLTAPKVFVVTYTLAGTEHKSTVKTGSLVDAVNDVDGKLKALGLNAEITGVARQ